jgi:hypothetical protein
MVPPRRPVQGASRLQPSIFVGHIAQFLNVVMALVPVLYLAIEVIFAPCSYSCAIPLLLGIVGLSFCHFS